MSLTGRDSPGVILLQRQTKPDAKLKLSKEIKENWKEGETVLDVERIWNFHVCIEPVFSCWQGIDGWMGHDTFFVCCYFLNLRILMIWL